MRMKSHVWWEVCHFPFAAMMCSPQTWSKDEFSPCISIPLLPPFSSFYSFNIFCGKFHLNIVELFSTECKTSLGFNNMLGIFITRTLAIRLPEAVWWPLWRVFSVISFIFKTCSQYWLSHWLKSGYAYNMTV